MELYTSHGAIISTAMLLVSDSILGKLYTYTPDGIRSSKTVNGTKTEYLLNGTQILAQKTGSDVMWFFYDSTGTRIGVQQGNVTAYYMYNLQGDVVGLADAATGKIIAKYLYDAWGKCVSVENADGYTIGTANPFRYCGYYYDNETGFYYLQTRYYDPTIARFINADSYLTTDITGFISSNMFAYCENNPVMYSDIGGSVRNYCVMEADNGTPGVVEAVAREAESSDHSQAEYPEVLIDAFLYSLEFHVGFGMGLKGSFEIGDIGVNAGYSKNLAEVFFERGKGGVRQAERSGLSTDFVFAQFGFERSNYNDFNFNDRNDSNDLYTMWLYKRKP